MDFDAHMRDTGFLDRAADVRMSFFSEHGLPMQEFVRLDVGPVIVRDEVDCFREIGLLEPFTATLAVAGLAADGSRPLMRIATLRADGKPSARVTGAGGRRDVGARRRVALPAPPLTVLRSLPRTRDHADLPSSPKRGARAVRRPPGSPMALPARRPSHQESGAHDQRCGRTLAQAVRRRLDRRRSRCRPGAPLARGCVLRDPLDPPMVGHDAIRRYWTEGAKDAQRDVRFLAQPIAFDGATGFALWRAAFVRVQSGSRVELEGVLSAGFDAQMRCTAFREWWHRRET